MAGGPGVASNASPTAPAVPDGFVANEQQALITVWLGDATLVVPAGLPVTLFGRGDFWAKSVYAEAAIGQKVFANLYSGRVLGAAAGSFPTLSFGSSAQFTASVPANSNTMTVSAVASGVLAVGQLVTGPGIPQNTYIESLGTGTGSTGTYFLSQYPPIACSGAFSSQTPDGLGGAVGTASFATNVMTVTGVTSGAFAAGQLIQSAGVAAGTYITSLGTGTGGTGTYNLSTSPGTIAAQAVSASSWIETPFYVNSPGNIGDVIKIGVRN